MFRAMAAELQIHCTDIGFKGGCASKTPTLDKAFANAAHLIIGVIGSLAVIFIIVAAVQFTLSNGNPKRIAAAKATLTYAIIGVALSMLAYVIVTFVAAIGK